jgi:hypothetical protein
MRYVSFVFLAVFAAGSLNAQEVTAGIYGTVQDSSSAVIPNAAVVLHNVDTGRDYQTVSDASGAFSLTLIPIGNYSVSAQAVGFKKANINGVTLLVNDKRRVDFSLEVGQTSDTMTVTAELVNVNTANGTTSAVVTNAQLINLPSTARAVLPFALLMPGAVSTAPTSATANYTSVNGIRPTHNAWVLDGGYDIDTGGNWGVLLAPNMEIVEEVRAIRGNYSAEFGTGGGSQFNVITKNGTNLIHGSAYEFLRNSAMNARSYFQPTLPVLKNNEFGFTLGGPVVIPKIYNGKNKTFFFVNADWNPLRSQTQFLDKLPEAAYLTGNFSGLGKTITDPSNGNTPFPGNIIPSSRIDPNAAIYAKQYPATNFRDSIGDNYAVNQPQVQNVYQYTARIDHNFTDKYRLMGRWTENHSDNNYFVSTEPGFDFMKRDDVTGVSHMVIDQTSAFKANLINDFNFVRVHNRLQYFPQGLSPASGINIPPYFPINSQTYPLSNLNLSAIPQRVPGITLTNYTGISPSTPWSNFESIYDIKDNITWIKGAHTIKTGFDFAYEHKFEPTVTDVWGVFTFDGKQTGDAVADLLLGRAAQFTTSNTVAFNDNNRKAVEAYVDDSWKLSRKLMINVGVRYSLFLPAYETDGKYRVFDPAHYDPKQAVTVNAQGYIIPGSGNELNGLVNPANLWKYSKKNFAPRVSFAYDLRGDGRTAIRGGYGIFYSREILGAFILMSGNPPFQQQALIYNTSLSNPAAGNTLGFDVPITLGSNDLNQHTPYTEQYNFNIQHELSNSWMLEVGYAGSHGVHLMRTQDLNQPLPNVGIANKTLNANQLRPYAGYGIISNREQSYASKYNGLQVELTHRMSHGFMFKADYTWSKALDTTDCCSGNIYNWYANTQNASTEWGRSSMDAEHNFISYFVYELPFMRDHQKLTGKLLGGWQLSAIITIQTGLPIDPVLGIDQAGIGSTSRQRPQVVGSPVLDRSQRTVSEWFNPANYVLPTIGTFATTSRNFISMPGTNNWDMSMYKTFTLKERTSLQFRADAFNPWNHTEFNTVGLTYSTPSTFGKVTAAKNARNLMLGLRLQW